MERSRHVPQGQQRMALKGLGTRERSRHAPEGQQRMDLKGLGTMKRSRHAPQGQQRIAQGNALGMLTAANAP